MSVSWIVRTFAIGTVAGLRSMAAPAVTLRAHDSVWAGPVALASAGELVVDKLPVAPARTSPPAVLVRLLSGALSGRALASRGETSLAVGSGCGALGALAGTYGGYHARRYLTQNLGWPDTPVALVEDVLTFGIALFAVA